MHEFSGYRTDTGDKSDPLAVGDEFTAADIDGSLKLSLNEIKAYDGARALFNTFSIDRRKGSLSKVDLNSVSNTDLPEMF